MPHDLTKAEVVPALLAWSCFVGCSDPLRETLPASLSWLRARWDAGDEHLPLGLVHDLGHVLLRGRDFRFASSRDLARWPASERESRLRYEDRVLGRWALDPSVLDAHVAIAGMAPAHRDAAIAHAVGLALAPVLRGTDSLVLGNPAHLRALGPEALARVPSGFEGWAAVVDDGWRRWSHDQLEDCVRALPAGRLLHPEDLWELAHLPELPSESARLSLREVNRMAAGIGRVSPAVALSVRHTAREVPVDAEESDVYPAGGFDAVSTRGAFDNLVRSEVSYVGEGTTEPGGVDLFDVRFAESELLYYTRDESPLMDARRDVTLVLDRPAEQRTKHPDVPGQTLVLTQALVLALQADLVRVFGTAGSRSRVAWRCATPEDRAAANEERALLAIPLAAEIAHRRVELSVVTAWADLADVGRVVFSPRPPDRDVPAAAWVRVSEACWTMADETFDAREAPAALRPLADQLLVTVTRRARPPPRSRRKA